jgi:hypothetical protein
MLALPAKQVVFLLAGDYPVGSEVGILKAKPTRE